MRKRSFSNHLTIVFAAITAFLFIPFSVGLASAQEGLKKIADNVYSYADIRNAFPKNGFGANAGIVVGKDGILVVDTLISSIKARKFLEDIRAISDKPINVLLP
jgi:cyclase